MTIADLLAKSARLRDEAHENVKQAKRVQDAVAEILVDTDGRAQISAWVRVNALLDPPGLTA